MSTAAEAMAGAIRDGSTATITDDGARNVLALLDERCGWVVVPVVATEGMFRAGSTEPLHRALWRWGAMLAARPK